MGLGSDILRTSCILTATILPVSISIRIDFQDSHFRDVCSHCTTVFSSLSALLLYARLILATNAAARSISSLPRCHLCSQAIKPTCFTLSPEENAQLSQCPGGSRVVKQQQKLAMNYFSEERHGLGEVESEVGKENRDIALYFYSKWPGLPGERQ